MTSTKNPKGKPKKAGGKAPDAKATGAKRQAPKRAPAGDDAAKVLGEPEIEVPAFANARVAELEIEVAETKDQLLRALAEAENVRKRAQREREDLSKYGAAALARDMVGVADNLRRGLDAIDANARKGDQALDALATGVEMTEASLLASLERHGIKKIEPLGEKFDPNFHEAMMQVPDSGKKAGTVVRLMQPGYILHGRLLRPAMVGVATGESDEKQTPPHLDTTA